MMLAQASTGLRGEEQEEVYMGISSGTEVFWYGRIPTHGGKAGEIPMANLDRVRIGKVRMYLVA